MAMEVPVRGKINNNQNYSHMKNKQLILALAACLLFARCNKDDDYSMSSADREYMNKVAYANNAEVDAGKLAADAATGATARDFGQMMVDDHTTAQNELQSVAKMKKQSLPASPDSTHIAMKQLLMLTVGTRQFDSTSMHMQVADHANTISLLQTIASNAADQDLKNYANKYLPRVQMHKQKADSIINELGY